MHFHFIGICGTAMGSVAAGLRDLGHEVSGSDANAYPPMSTFLEEKGVSVREGFRAENLPQDDGATVVVGNAISRGNEELEAALDARLLYTSLPEVLKTQFLRGRRNLVVTGTHGKTTTSSMLAWILKDAERDPSWMIGGIPADLGQGCYLGGQELVVLEGDEYDTAFFDKRSKFVHYLPELVIVNNVEFDHADIFEDLDAIKLSFRRMLNIVPRGGVVFVNGDCANSLAVAEGCPAPVVTVGMSKGCGMRIADLDLRSEGSGFTIDGQHYKISQVGEFNVRNAAMAVCAASFHGVEVSRIREALAGFRGVARRQQLRGEVRGIRVVDDFAHHPTAIRGVIAATRQRFPDARIWALFEPRSNTTRRSILQGELTEALACADRVAIASVNRADQLEDNERLDPDRVVADLEAGGTAAFHGKDADAIIRHVVPEAAAGDVVVVLSNGAFGGIHQKLLLALS